MSNLKPDVRQMIEIGMDCGLQSVEEAYYNYMNHYDCFFLIKNYQQQYRDFLRDLGIADLQEETEVGKIRLVDKLLIDI